MNAGRLAAVNLVASLLPLILGGCGLAFLSGTVRFAWVRDPNSWPWEFTVSLLFASLATAAGIADWFYHRRAGVVVSPKERRAEAKALAFGGLPLFALLGAATVQLDPKPFLLPIIAALVVTTVLVCADEFQFHRRCTTFEHILHRLLLGGHLLALLSWIHFLFAVQAPL